VVNINIIELFNQYKPDINTSSLLTYIKGFPVCGPLPKKIFSYAHDIAAMLLKYSNTAVILLEYSVLHG